MKPSRVRVVAADRLEVEAVRVEAARPAGVVTVAAETGAEVAVAVAVDRAAAVVAGDHISTFFKMLFSAGSGLVRLLPQAS